MRSQKKVTGQPKKCSLSLISKVEHALVKVKPILDVCYDVFNQPKFVRNKTDATCVQNRAVSIALSAKCVCLKKDSNCFYNFHTQCHNNIKQWSQKQVQKQRCGMYSIQKCLQKSQQLKNLQNVSDSRRKTTIVILYAAQN